MHWQLGVRWIFWRWLAGANYGLRVGKLEDGKQERVLSNVCLIPGMTFEPDIILALECLLSMGKIRYFVKDRTSNLSRWTTKKRWATTLNMRSAADWLQAAAACFVNYENMIRKYWIACAPWRESWAFAGLMSCWVCWWGDVGLQFQLSNLWKRCAAGLAYLIFQSMTSYSLFYRVI